MIAAKFRTSALSKFHLKNGALYSPDSLVGFGGHYIHNSVTHTDSSLNPWWRIDLGASYDVSQMKLFNRTDCCIARLNGAVVYVGNIASTNPADYAAIGSLTGDSTVQTLEGVTATGRYVMVRIAGSAILSLAEVQVFGTIP